MCIYEYVGIWGPSHPPMSFNFVTYLVWVSITIIHKGQRTTCRSQFSPSPMWIAETELRLSGWVTRGFTAKLSHWLNFFRINFPGSMRKHSSPSALTWQTHLTIQPHRRGHAPFSASEISCDLNHPFSERGRLWRCTKLRKLLKISGLLGTQPKSERQQIPAQERRLW